ncbi:MAG: glycosyltransferase family 2 protein, partial [Elusimicrobia bacterium]|nr:glycosyltransferase family 2 protein [Elusimicrobiota bacterium]
MKLSILIPSYNELKTLPEILSKISAINLEKEIVIVDDGSTDGTFDWLVKAVAGHAYPYPIRLFRHERNRGKGSALITAIEKAEGDIIVIQDADLEYNPNHIEPLVKPIIEDDFDVVYGSRRLSGKSETYNIVYLWGNQFLTTLNNVLCGSNMTDSYTGYKAFKAPIIKNLNLSSPGFEIEAEISAKISLAKYKFTEIPVVYTSRGREEGKKINYKDAIKGVLKIFEIRLG